MADRDVVHFRAAGIDLSKSDMKVCVRVTDPDGRVGKPLIKVFGATMSAIRQLRAWLIDQRVESVVMESTSAYWRSVYNGLEDAGFELIVANALAVKQMRGRKTDMTDAVWLAKIAALDMAPPSFVPPQQFRDLRLLTRTRVKMVARKTSLIASLEKLLEATGSKLSDASSKLLTVSGRLILEAMCAGRTDPTELAKLSMLRNVKGQALIEALESNIRPVHLPLIRTHLDMIDHLDREIRSLESQIRVMTQPYAEHIGLLTTIPGVDWLLGAQIIAETGVDMTVFPNHNRFAAWAGVAPGSHESAGKTRPAGARKGNKYLKAYLGQASRSAVLTNQTYLQAQFRRIKSRRGPARAYTAVAHSIATSIWFMLTRNETYADLGEDYFTRTATTAQQARSQAHAEAILTRLGVKYTIEK
jgi:transposase